MSILYYGYLYNYSCHRVIPSYGLCNDLNMKEEIDVRVKNKKSFNYLLALGHLCSDVNQGALSAVLPFLIAAYNYNYTTAATLVMVANIVGSIVQPIFGQIADRQNKPWIMAVGLFLAGSGMAVTGFIPNFYGLCIAVMISGTGIAMFHPQAAQLVNKCSDSHNKGQSISIFSFGGNLGFTLGPILTTTFITLFGLKGTLVFIIPEIIICILIKIYAKDLENLGEVKSQDETENKSKGIDQWSSFFKLTMVVFGRSIVLYGFNTFLALYWIQELGQSKTMGNSVLSIFYAIGALSTLLGGRLADQYGYQRMIKVSFAVLVPTIILLTLTKNVYLASALLIPLGGALSMSYSPMVVLGQQYLPNRVGLASGVTLGLAVSVGGIVAPLLGSIADHYGLLSAIYVIAGIAIIPLLVSCLLPTVKKEKTFAQTN